MEGGWISAGVPAGSWQAASLVGLPGKPLRTLLSGGAGGSGIVDIRTDLPECFAPLVLSLKFPLLPACQVENVKDLRLKPGAGGSRNVTVTLQPGIGGHRLCRSTGLPKAKDGSSRARAV